MNWLSGVLVAGLMLLSGQTIVTGHRHVSSAAVPLNPCLISAWPMNDGSGTVLNDASGNFNTGTLTGGTWQTNAGFPGTTLLNPTATTTSTTLADFTGTTPFSVSAWIRLTVLTIHVFMGTIQSPTYNGWELGAASVTGSGNQLSFFLLNDNGSGNKLGVHGSTNIEDGNRHYVVATYDGSRNATGVKLYVDGTAETINVDYNGLTASTVSGRTVKLGFRNSDGLFVHGVLADTEIYNCVLTPTQITTYNAAGPGVH